MKIREVIKLIEADGKGTLNSILKQASLKPKRRKGL